jgi:hypothetical protein
MSSTRNERRRKRRRAAPLVGMAREIERISKALGESPIATVKMLAGCDRDGTFTPTNCGWSTYRAAPIVAGLAREELCRRYGTKERAEP